MFRIANLFGALLIVGSLVSPVAQAAEETPAVEVKIFKFKFIPQVIEVKRGDTVRWTNREKRQYHSVWFEQAGDPEPDYLFPGDTYQRHFDTPGEFPYRCGPHPKMTGVVRVR